jgi:hypothetical protein
MATAEEKAAAKRAELLAGLAELGITDVSGTETITPLTGEETNEDLAGLLKQAKADKKAADKAAGQSTGPITVKYRDHVGEPTERTFSEDVHGEGFAELAEEFRKTNAEKLIVD